MKRYLARLAERATLAAPPATPAADAGAVADPFETVAPLEQAAPSAPPHAQETRSAPLAPPPVPPSVQTASPPPAPEEHPAAPKLETVVLRDRIVETTMRAPAPPVPEPPPAPAQARTAEEPPALRPPAPSPPGRVVVAPALEAESHEERRSADERHEERLLQQQLLRKADAFMGQLLDRRPPAPPPEPPPERAPAMLEPRIERESAPRLQPGQPRPPIHESAPEPPSLVIGRLTVEVLPSAPPAAPPRPPVVIVRGARGAGRSSFPSSRRFGIGQF